MDLGAQLFMLQNGEAPKDFKKMSGIGPGVYELRDQDGSHWYRVIYFTKIDDRLHILHSFKKKSAKTSKVDLQTAKTRLQNLMKRIKK
jgi:phage-related protein